MGWWNAPENADLTVGDAVLDAARHFLTEFSREYQEDQSRKPTVLELEYVLNLALKVNADDAVLAGFEELEVKQVTIKTAKRPKRQKAKQGDIFAFKLDDGRYGFGRIVTVLSMGAVAEFFDYVANQPVFDYGMIDTWLMPPTTIDRYSLFEAQSDGDWRIIGHTNDFQPGGKYKDLRFVFGGSPNTMKAIDIYDKEEPISAEAAKRFPTFSSRGDRNVKNEIEKYTGKGK